MSTTCGMNMVFHSLGPTCLLVSGWPVESASQYVLAAFIIFLLTLIKEFTSRLREFRETARKSAKKVQQMQQQQYAGPAENNVIEANGAVPDPHHNSIHIQHVYVLSASSVHLRWQLIDSLLFVVHMGLGYLLMLLVMTFQVYLFALVLINSFLVHALTKLFYEPWLDNWQQKQQDVLKMLAS